jgi:hypothetical protein
MKGIQVLSKEGPSSLQKGDNQKSAKKSMGSFTY